MLLIHTVRPAGFLDRMEDADRAPGAEHAVTDDDADGGRPPPHDGVDRHGRVERVWGHDALRKIDRAFCAG
jgi:hypothetical protein